MRSRRGGLSGRRLAAFTLLTALSSCAALLSPAGASALSEGRAYEMVTPAFKGGYGAVARAFAPDGNSVVYQSQGAFAGTPETAELGTNYLARRGAGGWSTAAAQPPLRESEIVDFSRTLSYALADQAVGPEKSEIALWLHDVNEGDRPDAWLPYNEVHLKTLGAGTVNAFIVGDSSDLCHVVVIGDNLLPEAVGSRGMIYDYARGCNGEEPGLRLVGVRNEDGPNGEPAEFRKEDQCDTRLGAEKSTGPYGVERAAEQSSVSLDGSEIFFTADVIGNCNAPQLFVRLGGSRTVEVSRPVAPALPSGGCGEGGSPGEVPGEVPCAGAGARLPSFFKGASEDGSLVFFTTGEELIAGETDASDKLFMAAIGCPDGEAECQPAQRRVTGMTDISHAVGVGEPAEVRGVVSIARDGSHVYFVAGGALAGEPNQEGQVAVSGADNLYVYDTRAGRLAFVGDLCSNSGLSGDVRTSRCPSSLTAGRNDAGLWEVGTEVEGETTLDGRFLVFSTFAQLIERGTQADADGARDVYRYDAQTGTLERVSVGEEGHDANGNRDGFDSGMKTPVLNSETDALTSSLYGLQARAVSADGSRIVFESAEPLSSMAVNGRVNVYVWHASANEREGSASIVSSGSSLTDDFAPLISTDGTSVFFTTSAGLVPADTGNDLDVYDARIGGGFAEAAATPVPCSSDACQGPLTNPAPLLVPGSVSQAPGENYGQPASKHKPRGKKKAARKHRHKRARAKKSGHRHDGGTTQGRAAIRLGRG